MHAHTSTYTHTHTHGFHTGFFAGKRKELIMSLGYASSRKCLNFRLLLMTSGAPEGLYM